jgi:hypothetical protein
MSTGARELEGVVKKTAHCRVK